MKEKDHFEDPGIDGRILKILDGRICIALTSVRIGESGGLL